MKEAEGWHANTTYVLLSSHSDRGTVNKQFYRSSPLKYVSHVRRESYFFRQKITPFIKKEKFLVKFVVGIQWGECIV